MDKVAVIMSTYNGEKYLREQIDSILAQEDVEVTLFVRDDGSEDGTVEILKEYATLHNEINVEYGSNRGIGVSFFTALRNAGDGFAYYAYSDQDDIWDSRKLIEAVVCLRYKQKGLYASNLTCVDQYGNRMRAKYDKMLDTDFFSIMCGNKFNGCVMVFTNELYKLMMSRPLPDEILLNLRYHDTWTAAVASITLGITYDSRSFILYRQHEKNVVGVRKVTFRSALDAYKKKIMNAKDRRPRSRLAKEIFRLYQNEISEDKQLISECASADDFKGKMVLIGDSEKIRGISGEGFASLALKVLVGFF